MEPINTTFTDSSFHIAGFPDAVKAIKITGPLAKRLADLALHATDLGVSLECLEAMNQTVVESHASRNALWELAIIRFMKCFGNSKSRSSLSAIKIYASEKNALVAFKYFDDLRNKHLIHDENSFAQCIPGAVVNKREATHKIAKIVCVATVAKTLEQANFDNLHSLVRYAIQWVDNQQNDICNKLTQEYESKNYDELIAAESMSFRSPSLDDINKPRV